MLSEWVFPPRAEPAVAALPSPEPDLIRLSISNDGEKRTMVVAVHFCTAKHAWFASDPNDRSAGGRRSPKMQLTEPLSQEQWLDLLDRVERDRWVVECKPLERATLHETTYYDRKVPPGDVVEMLFESPKGIDLQVFEGGVGAVGGNTWCALTARFSTGQSASRVYYCKTDDGEKGFDMPATFGVPEIKAAPTG